MSLRLLLALASGAVVVGCSQPKVSPEPVDGVLLLELGGNQSSLRAALVAAGVEVASPALAPASLEAPALRDDHDDGGDRKDGGGGAVEVLPADHIVVALGRGETLMHLAKKYLGSGNRFREILVRNGWTEAEAKRLPEGQLVKVPIDAARSPVPR